MTRQEFTDRVDRLSDSEGFADARLSESDYKIIEFVYMYYPGITTKDDIAELYYRFGMTLIKDMVPRCKKIEELENKVREVRNQLKNLSEELEGLYE